MNKSENPDNEQQDPIELANTENTVQKDTIYYYSREHRLNRASSVVQAMNEGKPPKQGFLNRLFGSKGNMFLFISILLICFMLGLNSFFFTHERGVKLGGNTITLSAFRDGEILALEIKKTAPNSGEAYIGLVDIRVYPALPKSDNSEIPKGTQLPDESAVFSHRLLFNPADSETYRIILPYEGSDFFVMLCTDNEQKSIRVKTRNPAR